MSQATSAEKVVQEIRRKTRRRFSAEGKIRIVLDGLCGEESIATLCRREGLAAPRTGRAPWSMGVLCDRDACDLDLSFQVTRLGEVERQLHAKPCFGS